jgi:hypothetical protein
MTITWALLLWLLLSVLAHSTVSLPPVVELCDGLVAGKSGYSSVLCSIGADRVRHCRIRNLVLDRSKLELVNPLNGTV